MSNTLQIHTINALVNWVFLVLQREMASGDDGTERWCVVIGGRGFAARHLVEKLISYNMFLVRIADMGPTISLDPHEENGTLGQALRSAQAVYVSMDLRNKDQVLKG